jgi:enoyl-CoA hydratase/carnithine racemase
LSEGPGSIGANLSDTPLVIVETRDHIATIALNRPSKRNALNDAMLRQLRDAIARVESDASIRVVILRGEGSSFCSGVDLGEKLAVRGTQGAVEFDLLLESFERLDRLPQPTIAVLQGTSLAGGWELALHCDVRFAAPDARFGMPLVRLGLVVPYPAAVRLIQIAGAAAAADLLLSASLIDGTRAHALNLVTHLVAAGELDAAALTHAAAIASLAPMAVRETKRLVRHAVPTPDAAVYADFDQARRRITGSADTEEGLKAFLERRAPVFHDR